MPAYVVGKVVSEEVVLVADAVLLPPLPALRAVGKPFDCIEYTAVLTIVTRPPDSGVETTVSSTVVAPPGARVKICPPIVTVELPSEIVTGVSLWGIAYTLVLTIVTGKPPSAGVDINVSRTVVASPGVRVNVWPASI